MHARRWAAAALVLVSCGASGAEERPPREPVVGLPCEGCEDVFLGLPGEVAPVSRIAPPDEPGEPPSAGTTGARPGDASARTSPAEAHAAAGGDDFARRPELYVGAAFAGGLVLAQLLRRLGR